MKNAGKKRQKKTETIAELKEQEKKDSKGKRSESVKSKGEKAKSLAVAEVTTDTTSKKSDSTNPKKLRKSEARQI